MINLDSIEVTWVLIDPYNQSREAFYINGELVLTDHVDYQAEGYMCGWLDCLYYQGWTGEYTVRTLEKPPESKYAHGNWDFPEKLDDLRLPGVDFTNMLYDRDINGPTR